ncbi:glycosyltransferase [Vibrio sp. EJY3]|uniref:glycosyltransferase n=1 Tax=Vibrio sp. (strain EJY3) TaxID=1116375 RepID=UPI000243A58B|nr:glycosyltransferase [Vibrio sp. EJY3]AEX20707.1 glycosyltransferase [Vibrio sp. EJY3]
MISVLYVNPQSYNNLSKYDAEIFGNLSGDIRIDYACSDKLDIDLESFSSISSINRIFKYNEKKHIFKVLSYLFSLLSLLLIINQRRPDAIHVQWGKLYSIESAFYKLVKKVFNIKLLFTVHNIYPHDCSESTKKRYRHFVKAFDHLFVHEESTKDQLIDWFERSSGNVTCITHGVIPFKQDKSSFDDEKLSNFFQNSDNITFSFVGYGTEYKGIMELLSAWEKNNLTNCRLLIAGKLCDKAKLWLKNNSVPHNTLIIDARISDNDLYHIATNTSVVLLPYKAISQSGLLLSTIPHRVPIVVTKLPGLLQPFKFGQIGWKIENCSQVNILKILNKLSLIPSEIASIRRDDELWKNVNRAFSWQKTAEETELTYREVVKFI